VQGCTLFSPILHGTNKKDAAFFLFASSFGARPSCFLM